MACVPHSVDVRGRERVRDRARRAAVWAALAFSALTGLALMCALVTPQRLVLIRTPELLGMLALLVLPGATLWAFRRSQEPVSRLAPAAGKRASVGRRASENVDVAEQAAVADQAGVAERAGVRDRPSRVAAARADNWQIVIPVEMYARPGRRTAPLTGDVRGAAHVSRAGATHRTSNRRRASRSAAEHRVRTVAAAGTAQASADALETANSSTGLPNRAA